MMMPVLMLMPVHVVLHHLVRLRLNHLLKPADSLDNDDGWLLNEYAQCGCDALCRGSYLWTELPP